MEVEPSTESCGLSGRNGVQVTHTSGRILLIVAAFALLLVPAAAIAAAGFTDVGESSAILTSAAAHEDTQLPPNRRVGLESITGRPRTPSISEASHSVDGVLGS